MADAFMVMVAALIALAVWASWRVFSDKLSTPGQRWAQLAFVWLVPVIGPFIALHLKRREMEQGNGTYRENPDIGEDFGYSGKAERHAVEDGGPPAGQG